MHRLHAVGPHKSLIRATPRYPVEFKNPDQNPFSRACPQRVSARTLPRKRVSPVQENRFPRFPLRRLWRPIAHRG